MEAEINVVEWLTSSMLQSQKFSYTVCEHTLNGELIFTNEYSNQALVLNKEKIEYYITSEFEE